MARILIGLIKMYQWVCSPLLGNCCRFYPTCSQYGVDALRRHGTLRGIWLTVKRIVKCHPFHAGGLDLVPPSANERKPHARGPVRAISGRYAG